VSEQKAKSAANDHWFCLVELSK